MREKDTSGEDRLWRLALLVGARDRAAGRIPDGRAAGLVLGPPAAGGLDDQSASRDLPEVEDPKGLTVEGEAEGGFGLHLHAHLLLEGTSNSLVEFDGDDSIL